MMKNHSNNINLISGGKDSLVSLFLLRSQMNGSKPA